MEKTTRRWLGKQTHCESCGRQLTDFPTFADCKSCYGPWAIMCEPCYKAYGPRRFGIGLGQLYDSTTKERLSDDTTRP